MSDLWYTTDVEYDLEYDEDALYRMAEVVGLNRRGAESDADLRARIAARLAGQRPETRESIEQAIGDIRGVYRVRVTEVHDTSGARIEVDVTASPDVGIEHYGEFHGEIEATLRERMPVGVPWSINIERDERSRSYTGIGDYADRWGRW